MTSGLRKFLHHRECVQRLFRQASETTRGHSRDRLADVLSSTAFMIEHPTRPRMGSPWRLRPAWAIKAYQAILKQTLPRAGANGQANPDARAGQAR